MAPAALLLQEAIAAMISMGIGHKYIISEDYSLDRSRLTFSLL